MSIETGVLYVVATPIGNLDDISSRALRTLRHVDRVAAEDTRHSGRLLSHFGIEKPLISLHEHNESARISQLIADLRSGKSIALVADAGTPLISDPGFRLLRAVNHHGLRAVPIPGPCSLIAALSVAGLPTDRFVFEGFLPAKAGARRHRLEALKGEQRTLVFFEASHRVQSSLRDMANILGEERQAVLARELTKLHEDIRGDDLAGLCNRISDSKGRCRGEFVVLVQGAAPETVDLEPRTVEASAVLKVLLEDLPISQAVAIAARITGHKKNALYDLALKIGAC